MIEVYSLQQEPCVGVATYLKVGGATHTRERSDRVGEGVGGIFPLTKCGKFFIFKNPEVTSDTY